MLRPRWRKVWRDLWLNRIRTIVVVFSIAVGVFAVGVISTSQIVLSEQLNEAYVATNPTSAFILTFDSFDADVVEAVKKMPEVGAAEARRGIYVRMKTGENKWTVLQLNAIDDFDDIEVDKVWPQEGKWPPGEQEILIERSAMRLINAEIGDELIIKDPEGKERTVRLGGTAHDMYALMYTFQNFAYGYTTFDTLEWLGQPRDFNDLRFTVAKQTDDIEYIKEVAQKVQDKLEQGGATVLFNFIPTPGQSPLNFVIEPVLALLGAFGLLALLLSAFLVVNMISALLTQQQQQIGIMKAVGARPGQIMSLYFTYAAVLGWLALIIALPLGALGAKALSQATASALNIDLARFYLPPVVLISQIIVAFIVPLLAATYPILKGTKITVREAISDYGLGKGLFGTSPFDRLLIKIRAGFLKRPTIISLRNTFRRKARLILTLITLIMGGAIFISVFSVQASLQSTLDAFMDYYRYDVAFQLQRYYRLESLERDIMQVEGVEAVEGWTFSNVRRVRPDGSESDSILIYSPPAQTTLVKPTLVEGRWLSPEDENAVVINTLLLNDEPDLKVGDEIILKVRGRESSWTIVGIALGGGVTPTMFANYEYFAKFLRQLNKAMWVFVKTDQHTPEYRKTVLTRLESQLEDVGVRVSAGITVDEDIAGVQILFGILFALMLVMAILLALVGGLGLMGTMSINVLERTREMGVMRAVGASNGAILHIVIVEGILIGILSWLVAIVVALPISKFLSDLIGQQLLGTELTYTFSLPGMLMWLAVVIMLSAIAGFLPAWNASRMTVREVLAYE
ncbi:MAG: ABC transporter permease [Anaerolineae bacterium]|nr:ABC transporter permease [Anaerolineae bacterium]